MDRKLFNKIYAKYFKLDYFGLKQHVRVICEQNNGNLSMRLIKAYLKSEKSATYAMINKRIEKYKAHTFIYPQREKFTWACIIAYGENRRALRNN